MKYKYEPVLDEATQFVAACFVVAGVALIAAAFSLVLAGSIILGWGLLGLQATK